MYVNLRSVARVGDKARKAFSKVIGDLGLKITVQGNLKVVNYLDVTLNLTTERYFPYRKPDNDPLYINAKSNHPPSIIRQISTSIGTRVSSLSCDQDNIYIYICLKEKFLIICRPELSTLNKRNELVFSCRHRNKALLRNN